MILGSRDPRYCVLLNLAVFLEKWLRDGAGTTSQWLFGDRSNFWFLGKLASFIYNGFFLITTVHDDNVQVGDCYNDDDDDDGGFRTQQRRTHILLSTEAAFTKLNLKIVRTTFA